MYGFHVAKASHIHSKKFQSLDKALNYEFDLLNISAAQIFTHGPRDFRKNAVDYSKMKKIATEKNIQLYVHASYPSIGLWKIEASNRVIFLKHVEDMLKSSKECGAKGLVFHLPKNKTVETIVTALEELSIYIKDKSYPPLLFEMPACKATEFSFESSKKLNDLVSAIEESKMDLDWGLCIDTAHQWCAGIKMNDVETWEKWVNDLTDATKARIKLFHLNGDSKEHFAGGRDTHEIALSPDDGIWRDLVSHNMKDYLISVEKTIIDDNENLYTQLTEADINTIKKSSFGNLLEYSKLNKIPIICEINRGKYVYSKFLFDILHALLN